MELLFGIGLALLLLIITVLTLVSLFSWLVSFEYWYLVVGFAVIGIFAEWLIIKLNNKKGNRLSETDQRVYNNMVRKEDNEYQEKTNEYKKQMAAYNEAVKQYQKDTENQIAHNKERFNNDLPVLMVAVQKAEKKLQEARIEFDNDTTLDYRDKNEATIDFVFDRLERRRAESICEALNQLDNKQEAAELERKRRIEEEKRKKEEEKLRQAQIESERFRAEWLYREQKQKEMEHFSKQMEIQRSITQIKEKIGIDD